MESAAPTLIHVPESIIERLKPAELYSQGQPWEAELGSGDGTFLVQYAQAHPARNFLGVERLLGRLRKIDRKGRRAGLNNLRLLRLEASYVLEYLIPPGSLAALHVYFPDPWPKRKHRKNRLINERFTLSAAKCLALSGQVHLRTDDRDYFEQMQRVFSGSSLFLPADTPAELLAFVTDFERTFHARGVPTLHASYVRRGPLA